MARGTNPSITILIDADTKYAKAKLSSLETELQQFYRRVAYGGMSKKAKGAFIDVAALSRGEQELKRLAATYKDAYRTVERLGKLPPLEADKYLKDLTGLEGNFKKYSKEVAMLGQNLSKIAPELVQVARPLTKFERVLASLGIRTKSISEKLGTTSRRMDEFSESTRRGSMRLSHIVGRSILLVTVLGTLFTSIELIKKSFSTAFSAVEDFKINVASLAGVVLTLADTKPGEDLGKQYQKATNYAQSLYLVMEDIAATTLMTGDQVNLLVSVLTRYGQTIDITNEKQIKSLKTIANAIGIITAGQNQEVQITSEMSNLLSGIITARDRIGKLLLTYHPTIKEDLEIWKEEDTIIRHLADLLKGIGYTSESLADTWKTVSTLLQTTVNRVLRGGMKPVYEDILNITKDINRWLTDNKGIIQLKMITAYYKLKDTLESIANSLSQMSKIFDKMNVSVGFLSKLWLTIFGLKTIAWMGRIIKNLFTVEKTIRGITVATLAWKNIFLAVASIIGTMAWDAYLNAKEAKERATAIGEAIGKTIVTESVQALEKNFPILKDVLSKNFSELEKMGLIETTNLFQSFNLNEPTMGYVAPFSVSALQLKDAFDAMREAYRTGSSDLIDTVENYKEILLVSLNQLPRDIQDKIIPLMKLTGKNFVEAMKSQGLFVEKLDVTDLFLDLSPKARSKLIATVVSFGAEAVQQMADAWFTTVKGKVLATDDELKRIALEETVEIFGKYPQLGAIIGTEQFTKFLDTFKQTGDIKKAIQEIFSAPDLKTQVRNEIKTYIQELETAASEFKAYLDHRYKIKEIASNKELDLTEAQLEKEKELLELYHEKGIISEGSYWDKLLAIEEKSLSLRLDKIASSYSSIAEKEKEYQISLLAEIEKLKQKLSGWSAQLTDDEAKDVKKRIEKLYQELAKSAQKVREAWEEALASTDIEQIKSKTQKLLRTLTAEFEKAAHSFDAWIEKADAKKEMLSVEQEYASAIGDTNREYHTRLELLKLEAERAQKVIELEIGQIEFEKKLATIVGDEKRVEELEALLAILETTLSLQKELASVKQQDLRDKYLDPIKAALNDINKEWSKTHEYMYNLAKEVYQNTAQAFSSIFYDAIKGELKDLDDYFESIFNSILRSFTDMLGRMIAQAAMNAIVIPIVYQVVGTTPQQMGMAGMPGGYGQGFFGLRGFSTGATSYVTGYPAPGHLVTMPASEGFITSYGTLGGYIAAPFMGYGIGSQFGGYGGYGGAMGGLAGYALGTTSTAVGLGTSLGLSGAVAGSVVPIVGTIIGAVLGGLVGSLFGDEDEPKIRLTYTPGEEQIGGAGFWNIRTWNVDFADEQQRQLETAFSQIEQTLRNFVDVIGGDASKFDEAFEITVESGEDLMGAFAKWTESVTGVDFTQFQKDGEELADTIMALISSVAAINSLKDLDIKQIFDEIQISELTRLETLRKIDDEITSSFLELQNLSGLELRGELEKVAGLIQQRYQLEIEYLTYIKGLMQSIAQSIAQQIEGFKLDLMSPEAKVEYYNQKLMELYNELLLATDPQKIEELVAQIQEYASAGWSLLTEAGKAASIEDITEFLEEVNQIAQEKLEQAVQTEEDAINKLTGALEQVDWSALFSNMSNTSSLFEDVSGKLLAFGDTVASATNALANATSSSSPSGTPLQSGIDYIPYNNYPAMLHRGEAVVTARGNEALARIVSLLEASWGNQPIIIELHGDAAPIIKQAVEKSTKKTINVIHRNPKVLKTGVV
jgi:hypothetical protein